MGMCTNMFSSQGVLSPPWQMWLKTECQCQANGNIPAHNYTNVTFELNVPIADFGNSVSSNDTTATEPYTTDGGRTWIVDQSKLDVSRVLINS